MEDLEKDIEEIERKRLLMEKKLQEMLRYETEYRLRKLMNYKLAQQPRQHRLGTVNPLEFVEWMVGSILGTLERWIASMISTALRRGR